MEVVKLGITSDQQRFWMAQWRIAAVELEDFKRQELQALTEEQAGAASDLLLQGLDFPRPPSWRDHHSGLVEQQCLFHRGHPRR